MINPNETKYNRGPNVYNSRAHCHFIHMEMPSRQDQEVISNLPYCSLLFYFI